MSKHSDGNNNQILYNYLIWLCIYLVAAVAIVFIIPFPFSFYLSMFVLLLINMVRRIVALRRVNETVLRAIYEWFISLGDTNKLDRAVRFWHTPIKFYCMNCGNKHRKIVCPQCGSKAVRMG
jgi:hypothetical protein